MNSLKISGKDIDLGAALQTHVADRIDERINKFTGIQSEGAVTFAREGRGVRCDCTLHLSSGMVLSAQAEGGDAYAAFETVLDKLEKRVRRYKRRLKSRHGERKPELPAETAASYVIAAAEQAREIDESGVDLDDVKPLIIADATEHVREMTVGMAVMQLDLADKPVLVFKNAAHGGVNVVYRRPDGNIGWVDLQRSA